MLSARDTGEYQGQRSLMVEWGAAGHRREAAGASVGFIVKCEIGGHLTHYLIKVSDTI